MLCNLFPEFTAWREKLTYLGGIEAFRACASFDDVYHCLSPHQTSDLAETPETGIVSIELPLR